MENKIDQLLADYLGNSLSSSQKEELALHFEKNPELKSEFDDLKKLYISIEKPVEIEFDNNTDNIFFENLSNEKTINSNTNTEKKIGGFSILKNQFFKYAASFAGLLFTFWLGRQSINNQDNRVNISQKIEPKIKFVEKIVKVPEVRFETKYISSNLPNNDSKINVAEEIGNLKKEMQETKEILITSMLKRESAADRIQAVNYSYELERPENEVLKALIYTLDFDPNTNVRIAAADAIARFGYDDYVRNALVNSLLKQDEPSLQMSIIEILTKLHERRALPAFKLLADDSGTADEVKQKAEQSTKLLNI